MMRRNRKPGVVASVEQQTAEAAALAQIAGQRRLTDPRTNPAVRAHADQLRDDQHRQALDAEHGRLLRRHRVEDHRAEYAEKTLRAIQQARQTSSPARSVMALHTGRRRFMGVSMAASLSLSAGSAMGVAHLAHKLGAPSAVGYIAEVGLTGLSTAAVLYRSHLAEHRGELTGWQNRTLWALMVVPLLASAVANAVSLGVVGVFCSLGAAAFSTLAAVIADRSAATMQARAAEVTDDDRAELEAIAMGDDLFTAVPDEAAAPTRPELFTDEALAAWLSEPPEAGGSISSPPAPDTSGPHSAARALPAASDQPSSAGVHIDGERHRDGEPPPGVESAAAARRAAGEQTRARIVAYMTAHPVHTAEQIASALGLSRTTVKRHRRALRGTS